MEIVTLPTFVQILKSTIKTVKETLHLILQKEACITIQTQHNNSGIFTQYVLITPQTVRLTESTVDMMCVSFFSKTSLSDTFCYEKHIDLA